MWSTTKTRSEAHAQLTIIEYLVPYRSDDTLIMMFRDVETQQFHGGQVEGYRIFLEQLRRQVSIELQLLSTILPDL